MKRFWKVAAGIAGGLAALAVAYKVITYDPVSRNIDNVAAIVCENQRGTGVYLNPSYMITATHVLEGCEGGRVINQVENFSLEEILASGEISSHDDITIFSVNFPYDGAKTLTLREEPPQIGEDVYLLTMDYGLGQPTIRSGIILDHDENNHSFLTSTEAWSGNSGGIFFDEKGRLLGIIVRRNEEGTLSLGKYTPALLVFDK